MTLGVHTWRSGRAIERPRAQRPPGSSSPPPSPYLRNLSCSVTRDTPSRRAASLRLPSAARSASTTRPRSNASTRCLSDGAAAASPASFRAAGQEREVEPVRRGERHEPLERVLELAHVARPRVRGEPVHERVGHRERGEPEPLREAPQEVAREDRDVLGPLAQRRDAELHDVEPVVEILAEPARAHELLQVAVGRREDAHVHVPHPLLAHRPHLALLQDAQELRLRRRRELAHLVEQERPAVRLAEEPGSRAHRAGEGALRVPEELRLGELRRQRRAVEADERAIRAARGADDGLGDALLAGAALSGDEHGHVARRDPRDEHGEPPHRLRGEHHRAREDELALEPFVLVREPDRLERAAHDGEELVGVERLLEVVVGAGLHRLDRLPLRAVGGDEHDARRARPAGDPAEQLHPVHPRHAQVGHHELRGPRLEARERRGAVRRLFHEEPLALEDLAQRVADAGVVVDDEDARERAHAARPPPASTGRGRTSSAAVPPPGRGARTRSPPCCRASARAIVSPSP